MASLEARHKTDDSKHWMRELPVGKTIRLGRVTATADWAAEWDNQISGSSGYHVTLTWSDGRLHVKRRMTPRPTTNPVWFNGTPSNEFHATPGDKFVIGDTVFSIIDDLGTVCAPSDVLEYTVSHEQLQKVRFVDPDQRVDALAELPAVIRESPSDTALEEKVVNVLLRGVPRADLAALVVLPDEPINGERKPIVKCSVSGRASRDRTPNPNPRLLAKAIATRDPVLHIFGRESSDISIKTIDSDSGWAICVPLRDEACIGWALYLSGRVSQDLLPKADNSLDLALQSDLKFAELVGDVFGAVRQVRDLQNRVAHMGRFFNRHVLQMISQHDLNVLLQAKPTLVTVLFCDIRGSCAIAEQGSGDLRKLWNTVSEALEVMTKAILDNDGVVGDFQGDAAMGFWGWPPPMDPSSRSPVESDPSQTPRIDHSARQVELAAKAAMTIRRTFAQLNEKHEHPLAGFACGIGIAHGVAMAGRIGTGDQFKVGVFGPVVNLAARLESLTKYFRVPMLMDSVAAAALERSGVRSRKVARVVPSGLSTAVDIAELLLPAAERMDLTEVQRLDYESALEAFTKGRWDKATKKLLANDGPSDCLRRFMSDYANTPPTNWDGIIRLQSK